MNPLLKEICERAGFALGLIIVSIIMVALLLVATANAAELPPPRSQIFIAKLEVPLFASITFAPQGDEIMTIHADGRITVSPNARPTQTARKVIAAMQSILVQQRKCEVTQ